MRGAFLALACVIAVSPAAADVISSAPDAVSVTIYRDPNRSGRIDANPNDGSLGNGIALVSETRTVTIPAGVSKVVFRGVADAIVPQTARVDGWPAVILESNFDYDLLTPAALVLRSQGERVQLVRTDSTSGRVVTRDAIIRTGPSGILLETNEGIEALDCSGLTEKIVFARVPAGLADQPTLSMTIRAPKAGRHKIRISYLALGLDWSADYVANINPDGRTLNLTGWVTLINRASTTFANAPTEVVAGDLARDQGETQPPRATVIEQQPACWPIGSFITYPMVAVADGGVQYYGPPQLLRDSSSAVLQLSSAVPERRFEATQSEVGDYKLYTLPEPTTVAARQAKQVRFLNQRDVPFERIYSYLMMSETAGAMTGQASDLPRRRPTATLRLKNEKSDGLGKPLPAGGFSVMEAIADGRAVLAGEDHIDDTPIGLPFELEVGMAMDVWLEPRIAKDEIVRERGVRKERRVQIEVRFGNDKPLPVTLELRQPGNGIGFEIVSESHNHTFKSGDPRWTFRLEPGERGSLQYEFRLTQG